MTVIKLPVLRVDRLPTAWSAECLLLKEDSRMKLVNVLFRKPLFSYRQVSLQINSRTNTVIENNTEKFPAPAGTRTPDHPARNPALYYWAIPALNRKEDIYKIYIYSIGKKTFIKYTYTPSERTDTWWIPSIWIDCCCRGDLKLKCERKICVLQGHTLNVFPFSSGRNHDTFYIRCVWYIILYHTISYYIILYYTILYYTILYYIISERSKTVTRRREMLNNRAYVIKMSAQETGVAGGHNRKSGCQKRDKARVCMSHRSFTAKPEYSVLLLFPKRWSILVISENL
jgi:hypothetical protein